MKSIDLDIGDYHKTVEALHSETDRAAAVLAASFIESYLATYLRSFMIEDDRVGELFEGFGAFSDFKKRFEAAYAFGFITEQQRNDLKYIAKIGNHFAHHPLDAGFDKQPVCDLCAQLSTRNLYPLQGQKPDARQDNRNRYLVAVSMCLRSWHNAMLKKANTNKA